ncbi:hypothetical protein BX600DRAFT_519313 [Xylariales sp. PMI_506]|nr:hypothetical protein BX600DRAFT_519313 [Xylariales sp. PMI_506]
MLSLNLHVLGLGVGVNLLCLGIFAILYPKVTVHDAFGVPKLHGFQKKKHAEESNWTSTETEVTRITQLLAARDLAIAGAIISLGIRGDEKAVGELILWCMVFGVADVFTIYQYKKSWLDLGMHVTVVSIWGLIGFFLRSSGDM